MNMSVVVLRDLHWDVKVILCLLHRYSAHVDHVRWWLAHLSWLILLSLIQILNIVLKPILIEYRLLHLSCSNVLQSLRGELLTEFVGLALEGVRLLGLLLVLGS